MFHNNKGNAAFRTQALSLLGIASPQSVGDDDGLGDSIANEKALRFERKRTASKAKVWSEEWEEEGQGGSAGGA
jgi:hypothetical protein